MNKNETKDLLEKVAEGTLSVNEALLLLKGAPFRDIGFAKIDGHRALRCGVPEIIYGASKTKEQIAEIASEMLASGQNTVLITRMSAAAAEFVGSRVPLLYNDTARAGVAGEMPAADGRGRIVIASGGTSDMPVAEEAAVTARALGNDVTRLYDVGVSGLHRLLAHTDDIMTASVIIAIAGMEGALASVIGGLAECPVIAVPTSVGYGASFGGLSALLSMLNSCASGVTVVNIDNGFGAAYSASMINHIGVR